MKLFVLHPGTPIRVIEDGKDWLPGNFKDTVLKQKLMFDLEDLLVDPTGPQHEKTVGGYYAKHGWYGFSYQGPSKRYIILVLGNMVTIL